MIQRIKTWFKNRRKKQTLEIIKNAKQVYLDGKAYCMCHSFARVEPSFFFYEDIVKEIPEFKPSTFGLSFVNIDGVWWPIEDRASRIKAFDKLIEIYSK